MSSLALSARLRVATQAAHQRAESMPFVRALFAGRVAADHYAVALQQWHAIYGVLEAGQDALKHHDVVGAFVDPALYRCPALENDLVWFSRSDAPSVRPLLPATAKYVERLNDLVQRDPVLLLAHHYVRYLGDLSGGQILGRAIGRAYALTAGQGTAFYHFAGIDADAYKTTYRQRLDALTLDANVAQAVADEANAAFELNSSVFVELGSVAGLEVAQPAPTYGVVASSSAD